MAGQSCKLAQKDSDARWTVQILQSQAACGWHAASRSCHSRFRIQEPRSIDRCHGLIRKWTATDAAAYDGARLADVLDRENTASEVWADTAYRSAKNEDHLARHGFVSCIHRKKPKGRPMAERTRSANARKSKVRCAVEHVFAYQKGPMVLIVRTIGIARARVKIGLPIRLQHAAVRLARPTPCQRCGRLSAEVDNPKIPPPQKPHPNPPAVAASLADANNPFNQPSKPRFWRCPSRERRMDRLLTDPFIRRVAQVAVAAVILVFFSGSVIPIIFFGLYYLDQLHGGLATAAVAFFKLMRLPFDNLLASISVPFASVVPVILAAVIYNVDISTGRPIVTERFNFLGKSVLVLIFLGLGAGVIALILLNIDTEQAAYVIGGGRERKSSRGANRPTSGLEAVYVSELMGAKSK